MIISRTPFRISFFGGGTDYPGWYSRHGGSVLATSIDKYCYLTCRYLPPFFDHKYRIVWSRIENCRGLDEIVHPAVKAVLRHLDVNRGVEIHHVGDLPARSGMGSSSSFTVGLLHAMHALKGFAPTRRQLADESIRIERDILMETVGSQDQVLAAHGGFNHVTFARGGEISVQPVAVAPHRLAELNDHLMLFYTGIQRTASGVAGRYVAGMEMKTRELRIMKGLVDEGLALLSGREDIRRFGELIRDAWTAKRRLGDEVSNSHVDAIHARAMEAGAVGGKITGAGGGGFMLLFVPPDRQRAVRDALARLIYVPFRFESGGSQIIYRSEEEDFSRLESEREMQTIARFRELDDLK